MYSITSILVFWSSVAFVASAHFRCPIACDCGNGGNGDREINCPKGLDSALTAKVKPEEYLKLKCVLNQNSTVLDWLDGLKVGPVKAFLFEFCPAPESIMKMLESVNATGVKTLTIRYSNLTNSFQNNQFEGFKNISQLRISSSGLIDIPNNFLQGLENLTYLELRENKIIELPHDIFKFTPNLTRLELGGNQIKHLSSGIFQNLSELVFLNLWKNSLGNLSRDVLSDVKTLKSLDVSGNGLLRLPEDIFIDLKALQNVSLSMNNFAALPQRLFSENQDLKKLSLERNGQRLVLPAGFLSNLEQLKQVWLTSNNISSLPANIFWGSSAIESIHLERNALTELPAELFKDTTSLETLDISRNKLVALPDTVFSGLKMLRELKLGENMLTTIKEAAFKSLNSLEVLNLDRNRLSVIDSRAFFNNRQLKRVDLAHNVLTFASDDLLLQNEFGSQSPLQYCNKLEVLNLANNSLGEVFADWRSHPHLSTLNLQSNKIKDIQLQDFLFVSNTIVVNLSKNLISFVDLSKQNLLIHFENNSDFTTQTNRKFILKNNPLSCNCEAYSLLQYLEGNLATVVYRYMEIVTDGLTCSTPAELSGVLVKDMKSNLVTCRLDMKSVKCPESCKCFGRPHGRALIVDCENAGLLESPPVLPVLPGLNHIEINLRGNRLKRLPNLAQPGYELVTKIYASNNNITQLDGSNLVPNLTLLELDHNKLESINSSTLELLASLPRLEYMSFYENPWRCDCDAVNILLFVQANFKKLDLLKGNMTCASGDVLTELSANELCPVPISLIIALSTAIGTLGIIIGAMAAFYYRYQQEVKVWLFARGWCLWFVTEEELDKDKLYDAFISYSHKDEDFVVKNLLPTLESGPNPFKLCLHFRDWVAGDYIPHQIGRSVDDSRRTVVILSPNFLESVWGRMEFRAAHKQALNEGRARVIVVVYEDVGPIDKLDAELKAYLSMNTYLKWGDPWFWEKLRYALPHLPQVKKGGAVKMPPELRVKTAFDDKLDLMEPTTPCATTPPADSIIDPICRIPKNHHIIPLSALNGSEKFMNDANEKMSNFYASQA